MAIYDGYSDDGTYYDETGFDVFGLDEDGYTYNGFDRYGIHRETGTFLDPSGVNQWEDGDDEWDAAVRKFEGDSSVAAGQIHAFGEVEYGAEYENREDYEPVLSHLENYGDQDVRDAVERIREAEDEDEFDDAIYDLRRAVLGDIYGVPELMDVQLETDIWEGDGYAVTNKRADIDDEIKEMRYQDRMRREAKRQKTSLKDGLARLFGKGNSPRGMEKHDGSGEASGGPVQVSAHDRHLANGKVVHVKGYTRDK